MNQIFSLKEKLSSECKCKAKNPCGLSLFGCCAVDQACDVAQKADVAAVVMQEGLANLVLVTPAMTLLRAKVEVTIPRKRRGSCTQHEKVSRHRCPGSKQPAAGVPTVSLLHPAGSGEVL